MLIDRIRTRRAKTGLTLPLLSTRSLTQLTTTLFLSRSPKTNSKTKYLGIIGYVLYLCMSVCRVCSAEQTDRPFGVPITASIDY